MQHKITFIISFTMLISACNNNATMQNPDIENTKMQTQQSYSEVQDSKAKIQDTKSQLNKNLQLL